MKPGVVVVVLFYFFFFAACNAISSDNVTGKDAFPGIYVSYAAGNYSIVYDTLVITKEKGTENNFMIERKFSFRKIRRGIILPKEYHKERWPAIYNDHLDVLTETKKQRDLVYFPESKKLYIGTMPYLKIK